MLPYVNGQQACRFRFSPAGPVVLPYVDRRDAIAFALRNREDFSDFRELVQAADLGLGNQTPRGKISSHCDRAAAVQFQYICEQALKLQITACFFKQQIRLTRHGEQQWRISPTHSTCMSLVAW